MTAKIVAALQALAPERRLNDWFAQIVKHGTGMTFVLEHNRRWLEVTRPIVEGVLPRPVFSRVGVRYGRELAAPPRLLPSGWAAFLSLYDLR